MQGSWWPKTSLMPMVSTICCLHLLDWLCQHKDSLSSISLWSRHCISFILCQRYYSHKLLSRAPKKPRGTPLLALRDKSTNKNGANSHILSSLVWFRHVKIVLHLVRERVDFGLLYMLNVSSTLLDIVWAFRSLALTFIRC